MTINRRKMLTSIGAATVAPLALSGKAQATGLQESPVAESPSPAMLDALATFTAAVREFHEAREARDWIIAEWRHLWPLAPEEILAGAGAETRDIYNTGEKDIAGQPLWRSTAELTTRLSAKFRKDKAQACFHLEKSEVCARELADLDANPPTGRTAKALTRNRQWHAESVQMWETALAKAKTYEAETARIREASGIQAALDRVTKARDFAPRALYGVIATESENKTDLLVKGETLAYWQEHASDYFPSLAAASVTIAAMFGDMGQLYAADIRRLAETGRL